jgi:hypothetical protein
VRGNTAYGEGACELHLGCCDRTVAIECPDGDVAALLIAIFGALLHPAGRADVASRIRIEYAGEGVRIHADDGGTVMATNAANLLYQVDKLLTVALQHRRPDVYFLHAAAVARGGSALVLAAPPGTGKSTLALALVQRGFDYLSDELAPVDVPGLRVYPYPHALCLKSRPPAPCSLPPAALDVGGRYHVPAAALSESIPRHPVPLGALVFLTRGVRATTCERLTPASASAHLMANALNARAHELDGLSAAARLAEQIPAFRIDTSSLDAACALVDEAISPRTADLLSPDTKSVSGQTPAVPGGRQPVRSPTRSTA